MQAGISRVKFLAESSGSNAKRSELDFDLHNANVRVS